MGITAVDELVTLEYDGLPDPWRWWLRVVMEPAKEPERALAQRLSTEQCDRNDGERHDAFDADDVVTEQRMEQGDAYGSAQRGGSGDGRPPRHPFAAHRCRAAAIRDRRWIACAITNDHWSTPSPARIPGQSGPF
jgi:hypothetical protein